MALDFEKIIIEHTEKIGSLRTEVDTQKSEVSSVRKTLHDLRSSYHQLSAVITEVHIGQKTFNKEFSNILERMKEQERVFAEIDKKLNSGKIFGITVILMLLSEMILPTDALKILLDIIK